jgi:electron transfer flavoprotein beta subunit
VDYFVLLKMVPDTVEELEVRADGKSLDTEFLRFRLGDPDENALEEALLLKEEHGGSVTVMALDAPELDDVLYGALAKGADRAVKLMGDCPAATGSIAARIVASHLTRDGALPRDSLILVQSQAIDDLEGETGVYLADMLDLPCVGVVTGVVMEEGRLTITKEFAGGMRGEFELSSPAVLGIQSARKPPRYVPVARVRAAMKSAVIEQVNVVPPDAPAVLAIDRMYKPEVTGRAAMFEGGDEEVAERIVAVLADRGLV